MLLHAASSLHRGRIHVAGLRVLEFIEIEGLPAHEIVGSAQTRSGVPLKVVQWTLFAPEFRHFHNMQLLGRLSI